MSEFRVVSVQYPPGKRPLDADAEPNACHEPEDQHVNKKQKEDTDQSLEEEPADDVSLEDLLDCTKIEEQADLQARFDEIAKALLCDYQIAVNRPGESNDVRLEIRELEFYLQKEGFHEDPFTHGNPEQAVSGRWYFHRAPRRSENSNRSATSTTAWRGGTRKGLDLTIGRPAGSTDESSLLRGGILLRSLAVVRPEKTRLVLGPSLLVDELLSQCGAGSIGELVNAKWNGDTSALSTGSEDLPEHSVRFVRKEKPKTTSSKPPKAPQIFSSPRIGLDLSHPGTTGPKVRPLHSRIRFLPRRYRYFRDPDSLTANGRPQTFLGVFNHCLQALIEAKQKTGSKGTSKASDDTAYSRALKDPKLVADISNLSGMQIPTVKKYLSSYLEGVEGGEDVVEEFVGSSAKNSAQSPHNYLRLMGAISTLSLDG